MSETEEDFFDRAESEDLSSTTVTKRLKKLIGKSEENDEIVESSIIRQPDELMWGQENLSSRNKPKFWNSLKQKEVKSQNIKPGYKVRKVRRVFRHIEPCPH